MGFLNFIFGEKKGGSVIGIDIGSSSIKVVQLKNVVVLPSLKHMESFHLVHMPIWR